MKGDAPLHPPESNEPAEGNIQVAVVDLLAPLLGRPAWQVRRGHGSFLTMEFGNPRLEVREPRHLAIDVSETVRRNFQRRRVTVVGEWHLWVQHCTWRLSVKNASVDSEEMNKDAVEAALAELDGQKLVKVRSNDSGAIALSFDLGGQLVIRAAEPPSDDDMVTLHDASGVVFAVRPQGVVKLT